MDKIRIYEVGGSLRNELLGLKSRDRDFSIVAPSYQAMKEWILANGGNIFQERPHYLAIKAKMPNLGATDYNLARKESFYTMGNPETVVPAANIEEDLSRRDFTMNAIAREVGSTTLIDPYNGLDAIRSYEIRAVRNAMERFTEDKMRIVRAIRFKAQLGFKITEEVHNAMIKFIADDFRDVKTEALQVELEKAFMSNTPGSLLAFAQYPQVVTLMKKRAIRLLPTLKQ